MKRIVILGIGCVFFLCAGCEFLTSEVVTNPDGTQFMTFQGEKYLKLAKDITGGLSQTGIPMVSLISGGVSTVLAVAIGILGKMVANRTSVAKATVFGIENFTNNYNKARQEAIDVLSAEEVKPSVVSAIKILDNLISVKENVLHASKMYNNKERVDNFVQSLIKNHKKGDAIG